MIIEVKNNLGDTILTIGKNTENSVKRILDGYFFEDPIVVYVDGEEYEYTQLENISE